MLIGFARAEAATETSNARLLEMAAIKFGSLTEPEIKLFRSVASGDLADFKPRGKEGFPAQELLSMELALSGVLPGNLKLHPRDAEELLTAILAILKDEETLDPADFKRLAEDNDTFQTLSARLPNKRVFEQETLKKILSAIAADNFKGSAFWSAFNEMARHQKAGGPEYAAQWGSERVIKADRVVWLFRDSTARSLIIERGVMITGARIDGELDLDRVNAPFQFSCTDCVFNDPIRLTTATIKGLNLSGTHTARIEAAHLHVEGSVYLDRGFTATDVVKLNGATVDGYLSCDSARFQGSGKVALEAAGLTVGADANFRRASATGEVNLLNAKIGSNLNLAGGSFSNKDGHAILASAIRVERTVHMGEGFNAEGAVDLVNGYIGGNLQCDGGWFINPQDRLIESSRSYALAADALEVKGSIFLRGGFRIKGGVRFARASIDKVFEWSKIDPQSDVTALNLRLARIGSLVDDKASWPAAGKLYLNGLVYQDLDSWDLAAEDRIAWVRRQPSFNAQSYDQLAEVFRQAGRDEDANKVLIEKQWDRPLLESPMGKNFLSSPLTLPKNILWKYLIGPLIGYGYRPFRAMGFSLVVIVIGTWVFRFASRNNLLETTKEKSPSFNSAIYSLDVFLPVIDLYQASFWIPNAKKGKRIELKAGRFKFKPSTGQLVQAYFWFQILAGWTLTTLFIAGLTGLIKR